MDSKDEKHERLEKLRHLVLKDPKVKQEYLAEKLKTTQPTISKDLGEIGARYDKRTGSILFDDKIRINDAKDRLSTLFKNSEVEVLDVAQELRSFLLRVDEKYSQIFAQEIVDYFKIFKIEVYVFIGLHGVIQILTNRQNSKTVTVELGEIQKIINKE